MHLLNTRQTADLLGLSTRRVTALAKSGQLPAVRFGREWLFAPAAVEKFRKLDRPSGNPEWRKA